MAEETRPPPHERTSALPRRVPGAGGLTPGQVRRGFLPGGTPRSREAGAHARPGPQPGRPSRDRGRATPARFTAAALARRERDSVSASRDVAGPLRRSTAHEPAVADRAGSVPHAGDAVPPSPSPRRWRPRRPACSAPLGRRDRGGRDRDGQSRQPSPRSEPTIAAGHAPRHSPPARRNRPARSGHASHACRAARQACHACGRPDSAGIDRPAARPGQARARKQARTAPTRVGPAQARAARRSSPGSRDRPGAGSLRAWPSRSCS